MDDKKQAKAAEDAQKVSVEHADFVAETSDKLAEVQHGLDALGRAAADGTGDPEVTQAERKRLQGVKETLQRQLAAKINPTPVAAPTEPSKEEKVAKKDEGKAPAKKEF